MGNVTAGKLKIPSTALHLACIVAQTYLTTSLGTVNGKAVYVKEL